MLATALKLLTNKYVLSSIAGALLCALIAWRVNVYLDGVYNNGFSAGEAKAASESLKKFNAMEKSYKDKIQRVEQDSAAEANGLRTTLDEANERIEKILSEHKAQPVKVERINRTIYTKDATPRLDCPAQEVYLGTDFSDTWNALNAAAARVIK